MDEGKGKSTLVRMVHERPALDLERAMASTSRRVIGWMFVMIPGVVLLVLSFGRWYSPFVGPWYFPLWTPIVWLVGLSLAVGGAWGCVVSIVAFYAVRDETVYTERSFFPAAVPGRPVRLVRESGKRILLGKYTFEAVDLDRLATTLDANEWRFVRDVVRSSGVFDGVSQRDVWNRIKEDFRRLGFVGSDNIVPADRRHELCVASPTLLARL